MRKRGDPKHCIFIMVETCSPRHRGRKTPMGLVTIGMPRVVNRRDPLAAVRFRSRKELSAALYMVTKADY